MSLHCRPATRQRATHLQAVCEAHTLVVDTSLLDPAEDPSNDWLLDVVLAPESDGLPSQLLDEVAFDVTVRHVAPQGEHWIAHITV